MCWLGHGPVLFETGGLSFLVDPVLSDRIGPRIGQFTLGLSRKTPIPVSADSVRGVDVILITHAHFDHLDRPTLRALADPATTVFVPMKCSRLIPAGFNDVIELEPDRQYNFHDSLIDTTKPRHWGARTIIDRNRGACAYTVRHNGFGVFLAGDTALTNSFQSIQDIDLAVFGIGAYNPWEHMHATPEQAWQMFNDMDARYLLPVHHSTFELSDEPIGEPMTRLIRAGNDGHDRIIHEPQGTVIRLSPADRYH
ncbi:MAG: hypothetical protein Phyf2KO_07340 [Phycisphaerales bacterium]